MKVFWPLALMVVIFVLSSIPGPSRNSQSWLLTELDPTLQNALHAPLYGLLQWLWLRVLVKPARPLAAAIALATIITVSYGCFDELHQALVPGRYASMQDIFLNGLGAALGTGYFFYLSVRSERSRVRR